MATTAQDMEPIDNVLLIGIDPNSSYDSTFGMTEQTNEETLHAAKSPLDEDEEDEDEEDKEEDDDDFEDDDLDEEEDDDELEEDEEDFDDDDEDEEEEDDDDPKPLRVKTRL